MAQLPMPPLMAGSPQTTLTADISQTDTQLPVTIIANFPDVGTTNNLVSIWVRSTSGYVWEICQYTAKVATTGNAGYLTIVRSGVNHASSAAGNAALSWTAGAKCARNINKRDFDIIQANITEHETRLAAAEASIASSMNPVVAALIFG